ncbi:hypothetical protein NHX12_023412 [Muraenolepis orangiensis]|uniref:Integrase zinc-binding domain-containing protein n=1 Tax=Muraenolepis orangiensis TaxID=630683 RepID=A0A9Q0ENK8_9TELE|nr:hypothetical protein NHX12_023412 [Muraenolepis orangiensis]
MDQVLAGVPRQQCVVYLDDITQIVGRAEWRQQQEQDPDLQPVRHWVEAQQRPPWETVAQLSANTKGLWSKFGALRLGQAVLQRSWTEPASGEERWQTAVLKGLRAGVLGAMHGAAGSGNFGVTKTLGRLRQGCYWGQCRRDVEDFRRHCDPTKARRDAQVTGPGCAVSKHGAVLPGTTKLVPSAAPPTSIRQQETTVPSSREAAGGGGHGDGGHEHGAPITTLPIVSWKWDHVKVPYLVTLWILQLSTVVLNSSAPPTRPDLT